jgi:probable HAF family extracellular repeat protein
MQSIRLALVVLCLIAASSARAAPLYVATPLGVPGSPRSAVLAMNQRGDAAGMFQPFHSPGVDDIFLFADGAFQDLGVPLGAPFYYVYGLNSQQTIVGAVPVAFGMFGRVHAFSLNGPTLTDLGTLGGSNSIAYAIADNGEIVGTSDVGSTAYRHAFTYIDGEMRDLGTLSGGNSTATAVNAQGEVTGYSDNAAPGQPSLARAFLYAGGAMRDIGTLGGSVAKGKAISSTGAVTGTSTLAGEAVSHAFLYANGTMRDLGTLDTYSEGTGVNAMGDVVGNSGSGPVSLAHSFVYTDGVLYDLDDVVTSGVGAARLIGAIGINDAGQIVVSGCTADDFCQSFGLNRLESPPPVPPTVDVIEYYLPALDHYFITAIPAEIALLDSGAFPGWVRTGYTFKAYPSLTLGVEPVCRYFGSGFGSSGTHFYSADANQCLEASLYGVWQFEGYVMYMPFPHDGVCPPGTVDVYRLYNNGQGGTPAHRYTTSAAVRAQMIGDGWIPEGYGAEGIGMCSPA